MVVWGDVDEVEQRLDAGDSMQAIAADIGVTPRTIRNRLHAAGRSLEKERRQQRQRNRLDEPTWLHDQYVEQLRSPSNIANELNVSTVEVVAAPESFGIARPPVHPELTGPALTAAFANGETVSSIARLAGVDRATARQAMCRHGIENPNVAPQRPAALDDPAWLRRRHLTDRRSIAAIAAEVGSSARTVRAAMVRHDIELVHVEPSPRVNIDADWLRERYEVDLAPVTTIAAEAGSHEAGGDPHAAGEPATSAPLRPDIAVEPSVQPRRPAARCRSRSTVRRRSNQPTPGGGCPTLTGPPPSV